MNIAVINEKRKKKWDAEDAWCLTREGLDSLYGHRDKGDRIDMKHRHPVVREQVAERTNDLVVLKKLANDHNGNVRYAVAVNPNTPWCIRKNMAAMDIDWLVYPVLISAGNQEEIGEVEKIYSSHP